MTVLPQILSPWAKQLALFPPEIALVLGGLASRLAGVLGAGEHARAHEGAPDGFDGIARRGSYERLLLTEWFLHDELPDEFMRRVVSGEHSFLQRAFRREANDRRCFVLFDAGIDQLGGPRIAHLAALIVLAQRAEQLRATLAWGALQDASSTLHHGVTKTNVLELLRQRSLRAPSAGDLDRWKDSVSSSPTSEVWWVGSARLGHEARARTASLLAVSELLEPEAPQRLIVRAHSVAAPQRVREVTLEVPPQRVAVQLLRDPFSLAVAPRHVTHANIDPTSNIVFAADGRRLHVRGTAGTLLTFQIPNSPRAKTGASGIFSPPEGHHVLAVGQSRAAKRALVVTEGQGAAFIHVLSKRGMASNRMDRYELPPGYQSLRIGELRPLGVLSAAHACFIDAEGNLVELLDGKLVVADAASSRHSRALRDGLVYVRRTERRPRLVVAGASSSNELSLSPSSVDLSGGGEVARVFFGATSIHDLLACERAGGSWTLLRYGHASVIANPGKSTLVGVVARGLAPSNEYLVALDPTRTRVELHDEKGSETLFTATTPVAYVAASDAGREIAYITRAGELGVYSCTSNAIVLRVAPGGPS